MANTPTQAPTEDTAPWARLGLILAVIIGAAWLAFPLNEKITLGLDLRGGTHMELAVDLDSAVQTQSKRSLQNLRRGFEDAGVGFTSGLLAANGHLVFEGLSDRSAAEEVLVTSGTAWDPSWSADRLELRLRDTEERAIRDGAAAQVRETLVNRIDEYGVAEPLIQESGQRGERLTVQLPGIDDVERLKIILAQASKLEFRKVRTVAASEAALVAALGGTMPEDAEALRGSLSDDRLRDQWFALDRASVTTGDDLMADAVRVTSDEFGKPAIRFVFNRDAGQRFGEFTGANINNRLAVVLDNKVVTAPVIQSRIYNEGVITGSFTLNEAQDLVLTLKSGALPAKVDFLFESTVGPWLGKESIQAGATAAGFGLTVVVLFMLVWYRGAGINAVVALLLNLLIVLGALALFGATLTLPGIAGLILTIGMAVDANVIIFERIKEELAAGRSPRSAVDAGFEKALSAIVDANVTTLFAAFFLFNFGSGPIKGFGITLILGIASSMFTAIFVSRTIFDIGFHLNPRKSKLSIAWMPSKFRRVPFLNFRVLAAALSVAAIATSIGLWNTKGLNYGVDFAGGSAVVVKARDGLDDNAIRGRLAGSEFAQVPVQRFGKPEANEYLLRVESAEEAVSEATLNAPEAENKKDSSTRLMAALNESTSGTLDLNKADRKLLTDTLTQGANLTAEQAAAAADAVLSSRERLGILPALTDVSGLSEAASDWLRTNAIVGEYKSISVTNVGPVVGRELRGKATSAVLWSLAAILLYIWFRFELSFGLGAIAALAHDVLITLGILCLLDTEISISIIAALLTIVGYSLNDTIVVFDRIRENMALMKRDSMLEVMTTSLSQTLSRTLLTSGTTLFVTLALLLRGGPVLNGFALALSIGILVGTYSSIFVASPIVLLWSRIPARRGAADSAEAPA